MNKLRLVLINCFISPVILLSQSKAFKGDELDEPVKAGGYPN